MKVKFLVALLLLTGTATVLAAQPSGATDPKVCKGSIEKVCEANSDCSWVKPYTRKDGKAVKGFCRNKPGKASSKTTQTKDQAKSMKDKAKTSAAAAKPASTDTKSKKAEVKTEANKSTSK